MNNLLLQTRIKKLNNKKMLKTSNVLYWMIRDCRVKDNWGFIYSQKTALNYKQGLIVCYTLVENYMNYTLRHYSFLINGLKEVNDKCTKLNIPFVLLADNNPVISILNFIKKENISLLITDVLPLKPFTSWVSQINLKIEIPFYQVDSHNIVPIWITSEKQEYSARTIRPKILKHLPEYLTEFPKLKKHKYRNTSFLKYNWVHILRDLDIDRSVKAVDWVLSKNKVNNQLKFFLKHLDEYEKYRNNPTMNKTSNLSPWFNFGQISIQRCVLVIIEYGKKNNINTDSFIEEVVIRRELSDNFCYYNNHYDNFSSVTGWAKETLVKHSTDTRPHLYFLTDFEKANTHDILWNAAQLQLIKTGKMHGYMRMYWAKKILEWTISPEEALDISVFLNDKYSIDGNDPNGYVGCLWSIGGIHDRAWKERNIFGKIRYMSYSGCKSKFNTDQYILLYGSPILD